jgi:hypothetical protein
MLLNSLYGVVEILRSRRRVANSRQQSRWSFIATQLPLTSKTTATSPLSESSAERWDARRGKERSASSSETSTLQSASLTRSRR